MKKYDWKSSVVIVTGASSGIGRATSLLLARQGACLALAARRKDELEKLAREIRGLGGEAIAVPTDVTAPEQIRSLVRATLQRWGQIDVLVSNAGQYIRAPVSEISLDCLQRSMAVNFYSGFFAVQSVLPHMLERRRGHIVIVSTLDVKLGLPRDAPYSAAKCALSGYGNVLRQELYGSGVEVTQAYLGRIDTPMIESIRVPPISAKIPPEVVARAIQTGIERRKAEIFVPASSLLLCLGNVFFPRHIDRFIRTAGLAGEEVSAGS